VSRETARFELAAEGLRTAADAWAAAPATPSLREGVRSAYREAFLVWQGLEPLALGPAGQPSMFMQGKGLRDEVYAWPLVSACRIDQEVASEGYLREGFPAGALVNVTGLAAVEYLLYQDDARNGCPSTAELNRGPWQALGADEVRRRRAAYVVRLAGRIGDVARELSATWSQPGGFGDSLRTAGASGSVFSSQQEAVDEVFAALFFVDKQIKDLKLADPAGLGANCSADVCPELLEASYADLAAQALAANLRGLEAAFRGGEATDVEATGFDDLLVDAGAGALAVQMLAALAESRTAAEALFPSMRASLASDPSRARAAHAAVKRFTDLFKSQFVTTLNLKVPAEGAADND
jgi:predicted lipoprotein